MRETIGTSRLWLRPYRNEDLDFLAALCADAEVMRFIGSGQPRDRVAAREFLDWILATYEVSPALGLKVLVRKEDGLGIGHAGLVPQVVNDTEELEVGYWIAREFWGRGYATEAARALRDVGFQQLDKDRLIALIQPQNTASRRVAEKTGMYLERQTEWHGRTVCIYAINRRTQ